MHYTERVNAELHDLLEKYEAEYFQSQVGYGFSFVFARVRLRRSWALPTLPARNAARRASWRRTARPQRRALRASRPTS